MTCEMKPLTCNPARLKALSEKLIVSHYENNYGGAVKRLNAITAQIDSLDFATAPVFLINGLKREELIASNSMVLHELYFDGLGAESQSDGDLRDANPPPSLYRTTYVMHRPSLNHDCRFRFRCAAESIFFVSRSEGGFIHGSSDQRLRKFRIRPAKVRGIADAEQVWRLGM